MMKMNTVRERKVEAIRRRLPALHRIEAICPVEGPLGEEQSILLTLPVNGDDNIQPVYFPYAVPIVMEAVAREAGWELSAAGALGQRFAPMREGGIYPLLPMVFVAVKTRCRMFHNQDVWGYLNASIPIERLAPDTQYRAPGSTVVFTDGHAVHSPWSARTVETKIRLAGRVSQFTRFALDLAGETSARPMHGAATRGQSGIVWEEDATC